MFQVLLEQSFQRTIQQQTLLLVQIFPPGRSAHTGTEVLLWLSLREESRRRLGGEISGLLLLELGLDRVPWQHQLLDHDVGGTLWIKVVFLKEKKEG
jgi:hypothetical protein